MVLSPTDAAYPFRAERAFLCFETRAYVRHSFDGRRLVIWIAGHVRAAKVVAGALMGPGLTTLIITNQIKRVPWYILALLISFNVVAWLGWIDALRNSYRVVFDFVAGDVQFFLHPQRAANYTLSLERVVAVEVREIKRVRGRMRALSDDDIRSLGLVAISCYSAVLVRDDGLAIHVAESTDQAVPGAIADIVNEALLKGEWTNDLATHCRLRRESLS
jgi:hypothetical protein